MNVTLILSVEHISIFYPIVVVHTFQYFFFLYKYLQFHHRILYSTLEAARKNTMGRRSVNHLNGVAMGMCHLLSFPETVDTKMLFLDRSSPYMGMLLVIVNYC
jgi:hypothetical protein